MFPCLPISNVTLLAYLKCCTLLAYLPSNSPKYPLYMARFANSSSLLCFFPHGGMACECLLFLISLPAYCYSCQWQGIVAMCVCVCVCAVLWPDSAITVLPLTLLLAGFYAYMEELNEELEHEEEEELALFEQEQRDCQWIVCVCLCAW